MVKHKFTSDLNYSEKFDLLQTIAALVITSAFFSSVTSAAERIVLVIGNQSYAAAPLVNPVNDANTIGSALNSIGYATTVVNDASRQGIKLLVDCATEPDAISDDGTGKHNSYTLALLKHIGDRETDIRLMFGRAHNEVVALTIGQSPNIYGSLGGRRYMWPAVVV